MSWLSKLFGKPSGSMPKDNQPMFPVWLEQQGNLSVQDGLDRYIEQFMSLESIDLTSSKQRTIEQRKKELAIIEAEVMLLEQCRTYYGEESMSPEFNDLLSTKKLGLQMTKDSLEMKLRTERIICEAKDRAVSQHQTPDHT